MNHHGFPAQALDGLRWGALLNLSLGGRGSLCWLGKAQFHWQKIQNNNGLTTGPPGNALFNLQRQQICLIH